MKLRYPGVLTAVCALGLLALYSTSSARDPAAEPEPNIGGGILVLLLIAVGGASTVAFVIGMYRGDDW